MRSSMLHGSETWPGRTENEVELQQTEMRMVRWMCGIKLQDRVSSKDIISVLQQNRLRWYEHVLRKEDNDWVEYEVEGVEKDCQACKSNMEDAMDRNRWRKQISDD